jgi:cbb3-type cytochrome oxidase subunit 1
MNVSKNFMLIGVLFLIIGVTFGMYMGGSGDHSFAPVHAHINLVGFTLMMVFGLTYRLIPSMTNGMLATVHFWLHAVGTTVMLLLLYMLFSGAIPEDSGVMVIMPIAEMAVFVGVFVFGWNLFRNA